MRPEIEAKIITFQIELLEKIKTKLGGVLEFTNNAIQKGNSWMGETNNETFFEMNKFLIDETFESIRQCQDIGKDKNEECHGQSHLEEHNNGDTKTTSSDTGTLKTKPQGVDFRDESEYKGHFKKYQELDQTTSKNYRKLQKQFEEHKNETKEILWRVRKEIENEFKSKWNEIWEEFQQASNFMSDLKTENEDIKKQMVSLQEQIKEQEQKSETFMEQQKCTEISFNLRLDEAIKQQKSTENSFSLRLDEVMKDILGNTESINKLKSDSETLSNVVNEQTMNFDTSITNLNEKLKDLEENLKVMDITIKEKEDSHTQKLDDKSTELFDKIANVSSQVDTMYKELKLSRQQVGFFAQACGNNRFMKNIYYNEKVNNINYPLNNTGNHFNPTTGIFTAPCDGLYLCSLTLRFEIGENIEFCVAHKTVRNENMIFSLKTSTVNSNSSLTGLIDLKESEQIYILTMGHYIGIKLDSCSYFMCTLINKD